MKNIYILFAFILMGAALHAQDLIYVNSRYVSEKPAPPRPPRRGEGIRNDRPQEDVIRATVTEITEVLVKYKRFDLPEGPVYSIRLASLDSIVFASGTVQRFSRIRRMPEYKIRERQAFANLGSNIVSGGVGLFAHRIRIFNSEEDPDFTPFIKLYLTYEKVFANDRLGIEISPFIAVNKKGYGGTVHAKFYPKNYGRFRLGMGPAYTAYVRDYTTRYYDSESMITMRRNHQTTMSVLSFATSLQMHIDRQLMINYGLSLGGVTGYTNSYQAPDNWTQNGSSATRMGMVEMRLGVAYRF